ncbi:amino acid ABC transporter permease [Pseudomonas fakonensis]|uniref:Amino acid ABC transporter permease n=2 Tax=Pseudomonas fakonensis TaxID=2842355 RepID=A0ABX8N0M2_9PSED|nr:amino acid ABC transporter permease [Pseudomonas fakonensis]
MSREMLVTILGGIQWTVAVTVAALALGVLLGALLCAMRVSGNRLLDTLAAALILVLRAVPPIVWLFLIFFGIGTGLMEVSPFQAAVLGLGLITAANMAEIFRGALAAVHKGQWEAARALSMPARYRLLDVIAPQLLRVSLPSIGSYAIGLLKDTAIASTIGVPEIAFQATHVSQVSFQGLATFAFAGVLYIALSIPVAWASRWADQRMRLRVAR